MARNPIPGRLNRESNPVPGSMAGFNPQFYDEDGHAIDVDENNPFPVGNYIKQGNLWLPVSSDNPMPTKDYEIKQKIEELNQKVDGIINGSTPASTQLTGSYTEYKFFDALALTDTGRVLSQVYDISNLSKFYLYVRSTLDAEVRLGIRVTVNKNEPSTNAVMFWNGQQYENTFPTNDTGLPIPNTQNAWILLNSRYKWLNDIIADRMAIQLMATQVPTTGSISVYLVGRKY